MRSKAASLDSFILPRHGGDLAAAERRFGRPADDWLDLSTGINPFAYPLADFDRTSVERPPGSDAALREAAALCYGVTDPDRIVPLPGSQAFIRLFPWLRPFSRVSVVGPTYADHVDSWAQAGHQVVSCETLERLGDADVVVVVNPNTPDGRRHDPGRLAEIAASLASRDGLLIVDEAYADLYPDLSVSGLAGPGLLVLRSFGKFFGLAGLRLGFAIADPTLARLLGEVFGALTVSGPALSIGRTALTDSAWIAATREHLASEAKDLDRMLSRFEMSVLGGTDLFRLVSAPRAWALYEHLGQCGILVRPFAASPRWLRFGLPAGDDERTRLEAALTAWMEM